MMNEDEAFEAAGTAAAAAAHGDDPRLARAVDAGVTAAIASAYRAAADLINAQDPAAARAELHRRATALDQGHSPDT